MIFPLDPARHALFLDFDGTLSPIQDDPSGVWLPADGGRTLVRLAGRMDKALAIISGRDIRDLAQRTPASLWRIGGHGADVCLPDTMPPSEAGSPPPALARIVEDLCQQFSGVRPEFKGRVVALHFRAVPEVEQALLARAVERAKEMDGYSIQAGKKVLEMRPSGMDKGVAVRRLMKEPPFAGRIPVMVGDDTTDEDAMAAALDLQGKAVRVGAGASIAPDRLEDTASVWRWLEGALE